MKKVLLGTLAVLTLAACSKDEVIQQNPNDEITFTAVTNKAVSRAADGYCNSSMPASMVVSALYTSDGTWKTYFTNETYKKGTGSSYAIPNDVSHRYWPDLGTADDGIKMKFFAMVNATPAWDGATMKVANFTVSSTVKDQVDVLYAVQEVTKKPDEGTQTINFRHALSQIEFAAQNKNKNIYVEITGVQVMNVWDKATFAMPTKSTSDNVSLHTTPVGTYPSDATTICTWSNWANSSGSETKAAKDFGVKFDPVKLSQKKVTKESPLTYSDAQADASSLTTEDETGEWNTNTMYLLPQEIKSWVPTDNAKPAAGKGSYFLVKAKIWNVPAGNGYRADTSNDVVLWDDTKASKDQFIAIPIPAITWEPGKRYVYTFIFTPDGNGGYNPDPSGSDPEPVLTPITLSVTIDDFVKGEDKDVPMNK